MPDRVWFKLFVLFKSLIYLVDLYQLSYSAAFEFNDHDQTNGWFTFVSVLNVVDMMMNFFTSVKHIELNEQALDCLKRKKLKKFFRPTNY